MDAARAVLERLARIELLDAEGAHPRHLLAEARALLEEAEVWIAEEGGSLRAAREAVVRCRDSLAEDPVHVPGL